MNIIGVFAAAFLLNIYLCYLVIIDSDSRCNILKLQDQVKFLRERKRYLKYMTKGFGMKDYDAHEEYVKIESFEHLVSTNKVLEGLIKKHNL